MFHWIPRPIQIPWQAFANFSAVTVPGNPKAEMIYETPKSCVMINTVDTSDSPRLSRNLVALMIRHPHSLPMSSTCGWTEDLATPLQRVGCTRTIA